MKSWHLLYSEGYNVLMSLACLESAAPAPNLHASNEQLASLRLVWLLGHYLPYPPHTRSVKLFSSRYLKAEPQRMVHIQHVY